MKEVAFVVVLLCLGGCAANQGPNGQAANQANNMRQAALANLTDYCKGLMTEKALDPIRSKVVIFGEHQPTFDMLANEDHVTAEERPAVREWATLNIRCQEQARLYFQQYWTPAHVTIYNAAADSGNALKAQLYNGQLTYGQYNQQRQKLVADYRATVLRLNAELARGDAEAQYRAQQLAQQQWQNYLILQQNVLQQQRAYQQQWQQQHGTVTCNQIGQFTYCNY